MSLPLVHLKGSAFDQGVQHGMQLGERVEENVRVYFDRFDTEAGLSRAEVLERATLYLGAIERSAPEYHQGLQGICEGSGCSLLEIAAVNVRYEILYYECARKAIAEGNDGCTAFAVLPERSSNGHLLLGQNWDWIPQVQGALVHTVEPDGLETLGFTEAGVLGAKIGLNSEGVGLCVNGMMTTGDDWSSLRKPFHVRCHEILRSRDLEDAVDAVGDEPRACSANFLIAQAPDQVVDVEAAPEAVRLLTERHGLLVHTNHFLDPAAVGVEEPPRPRSHTRTRLAKMQALLDERETLSVEDIEDFVRNHEGTPFSICRHEDWDDVPSNHHITVTSVIMDLHDLTLQATDGPPCGSDFQKESLARS